MRRKSKGDSYQEWLESCIQVLSLFLNSYIETSDEGAPSNEEIQEISIVTQRTIRHGTPNQQSRLYLLLLNARDALKKQGNKPRQIPLVQLTDLFKQLAPAISWEVEGGIPCNLQAPSNGTSSAAKK